jgi:hypothetical protein
MEEIKEALQPLIIDALKLLGVIACLLATNILTIIKNKVKHSYIKNKIFDLAVNKALKIEGLKGLSGNDKWIRLVDVLGKAGIKEKDLLEIEAEVMAKVNEEYKNIRRIK